MVSESFIKWRTAMMVGFISRHLVWELPESMYDLADRDDSTPAGRRILALLLLAHVAAAGYLLHLAFF